MSLPRDRFATRLAASPLLADGGMGTLLFSRGIPQRACLDALASERPDLVGTLHREYLDAGADLIETLTFGANRFRLDPYGLAADAGRFNRRCSSWASPHWSPCKRPRDGAWPPAARKRRNATAQSWSRRSKR